MLKPCVAFASSSQVNVNSFGFADDVAKFVGETGSIGAVAFTVTLVSEYALKYLVMLVFLVCMCCHL